MKKIRFKQESILPEKIIGISSLYADFQVAWSINNALKINLSKAKDISVIKGNNTSKFSFFSFEGSEENCFYLLANKDKGKNLSLTYKNIDYFLINKPNTFLLQDVSAEIKKEEFITGSFIINIDSGLKKILNKIFEY